MVSAASAGISQPNPSSKAITSSTVSSESAPRSSMKLACSVTLSGSTPRCSTTIFFTRSAMSLIVPTSCFFDLGYDLGLGSQTWGYGLVVVDGGATCKPQSQSTPPAVAPAKPKSGYHT